MKNEKFLEQFEKESIRIKEKGILVIVEGVNDKKALEKLGFRRVREIDGPLYKVVEGIDEKEVVLLTDLDHGGKRLYHLLKKDLVRRGVRIDDKLRVLLLKSKLKQVEGLANYVGRLRHP